jgi:hypothetical protein
VEKEQKIVFSFFSYKIISDKKPIRKKNLSCRNFMLIEVQVNSECATKWRKCKLGIFFQNFLLVFTEISIDDKRGKVGTFMISLKIFKISNKSKYISGFKITSSL